MLLPLVLAAYFKFLSIEIYTIGNSTVRTLQNVDSHAHTNELESKLKYVKEKKVIPLQMRPSLSSLMAQNHQHPSCAFEVAYIPFPFSPKTLASCSALPQRPQHQPTSFQVHGV